jgi:hypothetical protein
VWIRVQIFFFLKREYGKIMGGKRRKEKEEIEPLPLEGKTKQSLVCLEG